MTRTTAPRRARGHAVNTQVHVPQWNRWRTHCAGCNLRGVTWVHADAPCSRCNGQVEVELEEAVLDLEVRSARVPRAFVDVTVLYSVPGDAARLTTAARGGGGAVNREGEAEKKRRYPDGRAPWEVVPFAL